MSEDGFHVHGAHEHEVEHRAQEGPGLAQSVAIFTAVLATIGAIVSYQGGATQRKLRLPISGVFIRPKVIRDI